MAVEVTHPTDKHINKLDFHKTVVPHDGNSDFDREWPRAIYKPPQIRVAKDERAFNAALLAGWVPIDDQVDYPRELSLDVVKTVASQSELEQATAQGWSLDPIPAKAKAKK